MTMKHLLIFSSYPAMGVVHDTKTVGVASYTKNILREIKKNLSIEISVYAEYFKKQETYREDDVTVNRIWQRNNIESLISCFSSMFRSSTEDILISYEANMVGGILSNIVFFILMTISRLRGKKLYLVLHQVVDTFEGLESNVIKKYVLGWTVKIFYAWMMLIAYKIVVFEEELKHTLHDAKKVIVIPHAVESWKALSKVTAKTKLNYQRQVFYALYFGYLSLYKGVDRLIDVFPKNKINRLIIAGGGNPNHIDKPAYKVYIDTLKHRARKKGIRITGVIDEDEIPYFFSAADVVVLPYRLFFSSSGPLSLAFAFEKPVLVSTELQAYFKSKDFTHALADAHLTQEDIVCDMNNASAFSDKLDQVKKNYSAYVAFSRSLKKSRSWNIIGKMYAQLFTNSI